MEGDSRRAPVRSKEGTLDNYPNDDRHEQRGLKRASAGALMLAVAGLAGLALVSTTGGPSPLVPAQTPTTTLAPSTDPSNFIGIAPVRVLDTRGTDGGPIGVATPGTLGQGETLNVAIGGKFGVPANAEAVAVNITIDDDATRKSFLQVFPTGASAGYASSSANNAEPGLVVANSGIIALGTGGQLTVLNQQGEVNVIIDVTGYFLAEGTPMMIAQGQTVLDTDVAAAIGNTAKLAVVTAKYVANPQTAWTPAQFATIGGFKTTWSGTVWLAVL
jgi:hypothetical protein